MHQTISRSIRTIFFLAVFVSGFLLCHRAYAADRALWKKRQSNIQNIVETQTPTKKTFQPQIDPLNIKIPEEYGTIIESHRGSNGRLIVHIQDAHANYEGQKNLANILESLIKDYELNLILVEGGSTDSDFTYLRDRASLEERKEKAEKLLEDGIISGEEYLNIASDYPMSFQGIEDRSIYDKNVEALWEIDGFKDIAAEYVDKLIASSDILKKRIYNEDLLALDNIKEDYKAEKIDLVTYYNYLYDKAKENVLADNFPNFTALVKANELEKRIDLEKVKEGKATQEEIALYKDYVESTKALDINKLFKEEPLLEAALKEAMTKNPDQKTLIKISKAISIMKNLLDIKAVPEEYDYFVNNKKDFDPEAWANFLKEKSDSLNLSLNIPQNYPVIKDNLKKIEYFYSVAEERNEVFFKKIDARMEKDNAKVAALIAGGFHTPRLTRLLAGSGYSYIVVSPKVTEETDDTFYRSTLRRQWLPEE